MGIFAFREHVFVPEGQGEIVPRTSEVICVLIDQFRVRALSSIDVPALIDLRNDVNVGPDAFKTLRHRMQQAWY